jgi:hypothetical protein
LVYSFPKKPSGQTGTHFPSWRKSPSPHEVQSSASGPSQVLHVSSHF